MSARAQAGRALLPLLSCAPLFFGLASCQPSAATPVASGSPRHIVSLNPCVDALLKEIVDPRRIAAVSHYSQAAASASVPVEWARQFRATNGTAEEVMALHPDLVVAGAHVDLSTIQALRRMNIPLLQLPVADSLDGNRQQIADLSRAVGDPARGVRLQARIDAALAAAAPRSGKPVPALIWQGGGMVPGAGTLADELLRKTGFTNASATYGLQMWDVLPLEPLVANPPRVLLSTGGSRGDRMLSHPVLKKLGGTIAIRPFRPQLLFCAGPNIIDAAHTLADIRRSL